MRILILALGTFAIGTDGFMIAGLLAPIAHDLRISVEVAGQMVTVFAIAYAVTSPVLATLTGNVPRKRLMTVALLLFALANFLAAWTSTYSLLLIARILAAMSAALFTPTATAVAASLVGPEKRGRALSLVLGGLTVATALGVPLGTWIGHQFAWRSTFVLVGALGTVAAAGVQIGFPQVSSPSALSLSQRFTPLKQRPVVLALLNTMFWTAGGFSVYTYITSVLLRINAHFGGQVAVFLLLYGIASMFGNAIGGYGADHWGVNKTLGISLGVLVVTLVSLSVMMTVHTGSTFVPALAMILWGIVGWSLQAPQQHRLLSLATDAPNVVLSLNGTALYLGIALGSLLGGLFIKWIDLSALGWLGASFELLALLLLFYSTYSYVQQKKQVHASCTTCSVKAS